MEGSIGITIEIGPVKPFVQAQGESNTGTASLNKQDTKPADSVVGKTEQLNKQEKEHEETIISQDINPEMEIFDDKKDELAEIFEKLGEHLSKESKEEVFDEYLADLLSNDKKTEKGSRLVDTFAEMMRLIKLIFALLRLQIFNAKDTYSGKDLHLSDTPPEGDDVNPLTKLMNGHDSRESWNNFRKEVDAIENVPFSELMSRVLAANEKHSVKRLKQQKQKSAEARTLFEKRNKKLQYSGRNGRQGKPRSAARRGV